MSRPRIRSLKPEMWQDEKVGRLSLGARLLFVGLISLADDEGRFRALPVVMLAHVFPYDPGAVRKLDAWTDELLGEGLIALYSADGTRYGLLPGFTEHQRINRPTPSELPAPSVNGHGSITDRSVRTA